MAKVQKPCKICGKMFTPCADCERDKTMFHWRTVACSLKCATEYFTKVEEARKTVVKNEKDNITIKKSEETNKTPTIEETNGEELYKQKRSKKYNSLKNEEESEQIE